MAFLGRTPPHSRRSPTPAQTIPDDDNSSCDGRTTAVIDILQGSSASTASDSAGRRTTPHRVLDIAVVTPTTEQPESFTSPASEDHLLLENISLRKELEELKKQRRDILDHSIESDQRLIKYTNDVFALAPVTAHQQTQTETLLISAPLAAAVENKGGVTNIETLQRNLSAATRKIELLESEIVTLKRPCPRCSILREESTNMISTIRALEEQLKAGQGDITNNLPAAMPLAPSITVQNRFSALENLDDTLHTSNFVSVKKKTRPKKRLLGGNSSKKGKSYPKIVFKNVSISGDSHARHIAGLVKERLHPSISVSGMCKPGAGLMTVVPPDLGAPPAQHCHVLVAGTNDVAAGRGDIIYKNMENTIQQLAAASKIVVATLPHRYDLAADGAVNRSIRLVNNYMAELCSRYEGVELLDLGVIRRPGFTSHGMHLNMMGKRILARLIAEKMTDFTVSAPDKLQERVKPAAASTLEPVQTPGILQRDSYADVLKLPPVNNGGRHWSNQDPKRESNTFLGQRPLVPSLG